jgi:hypothetical protein
MAAEGIEASLTPAQLILLRAALRLAYRRVIETVARPSDLTLRLRDILVCNIVVGLGKAETDPWRLARRGMFAAYAELTQSPGTQPTPPKPQGVPLFATTSRDVNSAIVLDSASSADRSSGVWAHGDDIRAALLDGY